MNQRRYQSWVDALRCLVPNGEHGKLAIHLRQRGLWPPTLSDESARARMTASLNSNGSKGEELKMREVFELMQVTGRYDPLYYLCDRLGLSRPQPLAPEHLLTGAVHRLQDVADQAVAMLEEARILMDLSRSRAAPVATARFSYPADLDIDELLGEPDLAGCDF